MPVPGIRNLLAVCACLGLLSIAPAVDVHAQPPGSFTGLLRLADFDAACSKDIVDARSDGMCRRAIAMALGKEPVVEEVPRPEGGVTRTTRVMPADPAKASRLGEEACAHGRWESCMLYTMLLDRGDGVPQDRARAEALTQFACSKGHSLACQSLAARGIESATRVDLPARPDAAASPREPATRASADDPAVAMLRRWRQEQDQKQQLSPEQQPMLHQRRLQEQQQSEPTPAAAVAPTPAVEVAEADMITRCLAGTRDACFDLARAYEQGTGVARDATRSAFYYDKACDIGHAAACAHVGKDARGAVGASGGIASGVPLLIALCGLVAAGVLVSRRRGARQDGSGPRPAPVRPTTGPRR